MQSNEVLHPLDSIQSIFHRYVRRFDCILFAGTFALTLLVHLYMFTHKFINHDDIGGLYSNGSYAIYSGRWLIKPLTGLTGNLSAPWIIGVVGALFLSAAVVLMVRFLRIRRYLPAFLMAGCLVAFPVVASTYTYMFSAVPYFFSLLFAVIGAWLIRSKRWPFMILGSFAVALAMGCYQSYFCLAVALLLLSFGLDLLDDRFDGDWKKILFTGLRYVGFLLVGMALYFLILKISLKIQGVTLVSYQGMDTMGQVGLAELLHRIVDAYKGFAKFFLDTSHRFHRFFTALVCIGTVLAGAEFVGEVICKKLWRKPATLIFALVAALLFPLGCSLVYVMVDSTAAAVHTVMLYPMVLVLILPAIALDRFTFPATLAGAKWKKQVCILFSAALLLVQTVIGYECVLITNRTYFAMDIVYENTYAFYTKLTAKLELQEGYTPDTPVAFIGHAHINEYAPQTNITGALNANSILNVYTVPHYLRYLMATDYPFVSEQKEVELAATAEYQEMPCYPAEGSIRTINGIIVVKFS